MNDWFEWNGTRCTEYGIHVSELPKITLPKERATFINIPGRSGALTTLEGDAVYEDVTLTATCYITDSSHINEIGAWLRGSGTVTFANRQGGCYFARIVNQIPIDKILRGSPALSFAVNFRCKPFFYPTASEIVLNAPGNIVNPYGFDALPVITVYGSGAKQTVMVGAWSFLIDDLEGEITLDCENMIAHSNGVNAGAHITLVDDDWPVLVPGNNMVNWTGGISSVAIQPNWRTL